MINGAPSLRSSRIRRLVRSLRLGTLRTTSRRSSAGSFLSWRLWCQTEVTLWGWLIQTQEKKSMILFSRYSFCCKQWALENPCNNMSSLWDSRYFPVSPYPNGFRTTALVGDWEAVRRQAVQSLYLSSFIPKLFFFETEGYCTITTLGPQGVHWHVNDTRPSSLVKFLCDGT